MSWNTVDPKEAQEIIEDVMDEKLSSVDYHVEVNLDGGIFQVLVLLTETGHRLSMSIPKIEVETIQILDMWQEVGNIAVNRFRDDGVVK